MIKIDTALATTLHTLLIDYSGGSDGVRDFNLLDSALSSSFQTFMGQELYPSLLEKGARLGFNLISNHAFFDGNKRIGILIMLTFLEVNGVTIECTDEELINLGLSLAKNETSYETLINWLKDHSK
jgi:death-on-curing protein